MSWEEMVKADVIEMLMLAPPQVRQLLKRQRQQNLQVVSFAELIAHRIEQSRRVIHYEIV